MALTIKPEIACLRVDGDGVVRIGATRVPIDTVVGAFSDGASAEEIVDRYPTLDPGDVDSVIAYYLRHRSAVDAYLDHRQAEADRVRRDYEARFPPEPGLRERLLARLGAGGTGPTRPVLG